MSITALGKEVPLLAAEANSADQLPPGIGRNGGTAKVTPRL